MAVIRGGVLGPAASRAASFARPGLIAVVRGPYHGRGDGNVGSAALHSR